MPSALLQSKIHEIRNQKVMLDYDLAALYDIETKVLNQAVKRHIKRFPLDFMFQITEDENNFIRSQIVTLDKNIGRGKHRKYLPFAFTEQGIAMLSGILNSDVAIHVNIAIMRTFVMIRKFALQHPDFTEKLTALESKYDQQFKTVYEALDYLIKNNNNEKPARKQIGYKS